MQCQKHRSVLILHPFNFTWLDSFCAVQKPHCQACLQPSDANPMTTAQLEKHDFQLRKIDDQREEQSEAKGCLHRTIEQLCIAPLQNKAHNHPRCEELQKKHGIIDPSDIIKELVHCTDDSQESHWTMVETMAQLFKTRQGDQAQHSTRIAITD